MRIARVGIDRDERLAVVAGERVQLLATDTELFELLDADTAQRDRLVARAADGEPRALSEVRLLVPLRPTTLRDFMTFEEHVDGALRMLGRAVPAEWYERPHFYFSNPNAMIGPHDRVVIPPGCARLDFELEVAAIIGRAGSDLTPKQAHDHIAGYTILNDWSARDLQAAEMPVGLGPAKAKDFASTLGPWIVTADELEPFRVDDRLDLDMRASVNGREIGDDSLANMGWSFEEMVAYASRGTRVLPGDVLGSGTCGAGCLAELWGRRGTMELPPLRAGDVVTLTVEGIGTLSNTIEAGQPPIPIPIARARAPRHLRRARDQQIRDG